MCSTGHSGWLSGRVGESSRSRRELAYKPNVHARQLVTRKSRSLAVQVAGQAVRHEHAPVPNSEYFLEVLNGAAHAADEHGYALILAPSDVDPSALESFAVDGVLLIDPAGDEPIFAQLQMLSRIVTVGRPQAFEGPSRSWTMITSAPHERSWTI